MERESLVPCTPRPGRAGLSGSAAVPVMISSSSCPSSPPRLERGRKRRRIEVSGSSQEDGESWGEESPLLSRFRKGTRSGTAGREAPTETGLVIEQMASEIGEYVAERVKFVLTQLVDPTQSEAALQRAVSVLGSLREGGRQLCEDVVQPDGSGVTLQGPGRAGAHLSSSSSSFRWRTSNLPATVVGSGPEGEC
ncbi:uncharacterized protein B0I36DRAFT_316383 [Microdochium trichocladiopsis]|uniref:Uncharacterized protein n=1 Tax=Microdochium trichocladiopsis TaxID=1682393 RepID=A0A9P8YCU2_9PEZI|nr:uncharacterized protein B0I36DRAFT_316182 [Microdochium trichocladiopsis]XP_046017592.1 uncharacterized protein B0I36DRAFT_316372 [Microdochium trichocladiopsis]XP_046017596.1 uncharacterized protein B0I36DRAFT_316383 [Microdochium trichocladiopsis]KAH7038416.1 hypothetical protein B0I36DRAFT_316182 [Microdochium trichocladiopsis]KAH7038471.1 hypothetical protein B0I36DRAFT_316372 [Microdochium trichocladiopsis]KAH7038475.1 hypothetical protein B0I36DRAFT_316383 [Microdochium trichocladiops